MNKFLASFLLSSVITTPALADDNCNDLNFVFNMENTRTAELDQYALGLAWGGR